MAVTKWNQIRIGCDYFCLKLSLNHLSFVFLVISGTLQHPAIEKARRENDLLPVIPRQWLETRSEDSRTGRDLHDLIMKRQHRPEAEIDTESRDSLEQHKYQPVDRGFADAVGGVPALSDEERDVYINSINEIEMDNISASKSSNVTILENKLMSDKGNKGGYVVTWNSAAIAEDWWSLCQLPVFVFLFAVAGVVAISSVILIWFKNQMLQSEKQKKLTNIDGNQMQLMSGSCPCPGPGLVSEEQWICHTVINLKSSNDGIAPEAVQIQPQENCNLPEILSGAIEDVEKRPEAVRIKAKGLLERRGSSASLTIDLSQPYDSKSHMVTPTRECTSEEFLLSAGNVLSRSQLKNCLKNVQSLHSEFWEIPLNHPEKSAVTGCGTKNRYESILPNERSRVKLTSSSEDNPLDSYINANYIRGYDGEERAYIATQGPLPNTIQDLYRMAWNDKSPVIVMITKLYEKAKTKCESYFPVEKDECIKYGDFGVTVMSVKHKQGYTVRELLVENNSETRLILHYWYDTWPDHKTPQNAHSIVAMATEIENYRTSLKNSSCLNSDGKEFLCGGPVIVHCSAGIGRTGCFIAISLAICQLLEENKVDILGIVCQMRYDRGGMIQTAEQYEFVHRAIALFEHSLPDSSSD